MDIQNPATVLVLVIGTLLMQVLGRLQAWHLAVIAARNEKETIRGNTMLEEKANTTIRLVDSTTTKLQTQVDAMNAANAALREQLAAYMERDAVISMTKRTEDVTGPQRAP